MNILIASTSTVYGGKYLEYLTPAIQELFQDISEILFIPYARPSGMTHDAYTEIAKNYFRELNIRVKGIHEYGNPKKAIAQAQGIFTGGGNTFVLVKQLHNEGLLDILRQKIQNGTAYLGTSAGSNITGQTMQTTNDMPIVQVPSYDTLKIFPFNINPHYLDSKPDLLQHMGETRDTRLKEYLHFNKIPVVALREGSWIQSDINKCILKGDKPVRIYFGLKDIREVETGMDIADLF